MMEGKYLSVAQLAERYGVSKSSIYHWVKHGKFPKQRKFGTTSRWEAAKVNEWEEGQPTGAYGEG